ncbi:putative MFS transporter [Calycina marina]|uniref:MFS transporter n=1 Tax=Calycina marina TaxID=1763456 RepID=A0A9P7YXU8_9HELO|nr:putative MFS transporter [Calycina marina]
MKESEFHPVAGVMEKTISHPDSPTTPVRDDIDQGKYDTVAKVDALAADLDPDASDKLNPQNWPVWRKRALFFALMSSSILCDGGMTWGASLFVAQALEWNETVAKSSQSMNWGLLLQGFGGILTVPLIQYCGRYPIWFWSQLFTLASVIGATLSSTPETFVAFRSLQGLFGTIPQVIGLPIIHDMFSPEEWPRYINIWATTFLVGPFLGPALAGYLADALSWRGAFAVLAGLYGISTMIVLVLGRETYYVPNIGVLSAPTFIQSLIGQGGALAVRRPSFVKSAISTVRYIFVLPMLLVGFSVMINFTWPIGITVTVDSFIRAPPYSMGNIEAASMRFAAVIGSLTGFAVGYFFNEFMSKRIHRPSWRPETRLHGVWLPAFAMVCGLILYGLTNQYGLSWVGLAFGWWGVNIGLVGTMVAITSFVLEKYPGESTTVSAILNMWRTCGGFAVSYFQPPWITLAGVGVVFGCQAAIVAVTIVLLIVPVIWMGRK